MCVLNRDVPQKQQHQKLCSQQEQTEYYINLITVRQRVPDGRRRPCIMTTSWVLLLPLHLEVSALSIFVLLNNEEEDVQIGSEFA